VFPAVFGAAVLGIGISGCGQGVNSEPSKTKTQDVALVSLEAANTPGSSPWMESVTLADPPRQVNRVETPEASRTVSGEQIGLYGGSADRVVCDREKMVDYLERNPVKAAAWRTVTGAKDVRAYASGLSPGFLTYDTRVTNHGFKDGTTTSFPSVLQTGTAVLLDNRGLPRVRCDSGSPLSEPQGDIGDEEFGGTGWQNLNPDSVVTVEKSEVPLEELKLIEVGADTSQGPSPTSGPAPAPVILRDLIGAAMPVVAPDIVLPEDLIVTSVPVQTVRITSSTSTPVTELTTTPSTTTTTESTTTESSTPTTTTEITDTTPEIKPTDPSILPPAGGEIVPQDGALIVGEPRTVVVPTP
jgi:hypothetical protein